VNSCTNSPEDGPVGPKHVEIQQYTNKIVTSGGLHSICLSLKLGVYLHILHTLLLRVTRNVTAVWRFGTYPSLNFIAQCISHIRVKVSQKWITRYQVLTYSYYDVTIHIEGLKGKYNLHLHLTFQSLLVTWCTTSLTI